MKKIKTPAKIFISDIDKLQKIVIQTVDEIASIVGASLGPGGRNIILESSVSQIPNKNTKDGVSIFRSLGSRNPYKHLIIEQMRDVAVRTVNEAGDGNQCMNAKTLTPNGWVRFGDLKIGDVLCGTNKTFQTVEGIYPKGVKEIFKVTTLGGGSAECCADHLWEVTDKDGNVSVKPLKLIMEDYKVKKHNKTSLKYFIKTTEVEFNEDKSKMPIDPYLLGVLLGDGSLTGKYRSTIEISLGLKKEHILNKLILPDGISYRSTWIEDKNYFRVKLTGMTPDGLSMRGVLDKVGLLGTTSSTKFIPKAYLYSSFESRQKLLQGIIDTDGHINKKGRFEISTICKQLADDIVELCRSLGKRVSIREKDRSNSKGYSNTNSFIINEMATNPKGNKIINIESTGRFEDTQCIKVSNPDSLYITNDYLVTHNTTTATVVAAALIKNLFDYCKKNKKFSPQKIARSISKILDNKIVPSIKKQSIKVTTKNQNLLEKVATISVNGDKDMAKAVIKAFEEVGFGSASHVTIQELSGPSGSYDVKLIEGFPISQGYEESIGKFHAAFINDQANQRCILDKPLFLLFDGQITDILQVQHIFEAVGNSYVNGNTDVKNIVVVAHGFSDQFLTTLSFNFPNPHTINIVPLLTPLSPIVNGQLEFLGDLSAFTGAKIFNATNQLSDCNWEEDMGCMDKIEIYRFRTTIVGESDPMVIQERADYLKERSKQAESKLEKSLLEERLGKLTNGIAQLKVYGSSNAELKEKADRAEDAVCAVRAAINYGCLPGGCRTIINIVKELIGEYPNDEVISEVVVPSLLSPFYKLLDNAGYSESEVEEVFGKLLDNDKLVYDIENSRYGTAQELGLFDATLAVEQALKNAVAISTVLGTLGGIVAFERDDAFENQAHLDDRNFEQTLENANNFKRDNID